MTKDIIRSKVFLSRDPIAREYSGHMKLESPWYRGRVRMKRLFTDNLASFHLTGPNIQIVQGTKHVE